MNEKPDEPVSDLRQLIVELRRELAECRAERDEAQAQQAAATEVLQVINRSPGDLAPVFDAMLEKALRLCEAAFGMFFKYDGEYFRTVALRGVPPAYAEFLRKPIRPQPENG